jgi:sensor protein fixL
MKWEPDNFQLEQNSVWSFPKRGNWATHDSNYKGNCSPYVFRNLIFRYSNESDWILDQFVGGGTSLVEAKLLNRNIIGTDINPDALERCRIKVNFGVGAGKVEIRLSDARHLDFIKDNSIDFICTHPPYANIIKYSNDIKADISLLDYDCFLSAMEQVAVEAYRVLKKNKYCAFIIGDVRQKSFVRHLGFDTLNKFEEAGFKLKDTIIKVQHNCQSTHRWKRIALDNNFFLLAHEYIFVMKK